MRETRITLPELALIGGTRAALGAGLGLLLAHRLSEDQRRAVGWTLFLVGAISTVPLAMEVLGGFRSHDSRRWSQRLSNERESGLEEGLEELRELARS
jgi:hypothetical protein